MRSIRRVRRAVTSAQMRGRTRANVPVATLQELLSLAGPALERQDQYERAGNRMLEAIRRELAR